MFHASNNIRPNSQFRIRQIKGQLSVQQFVQTLFLKAKGYFIDRFNIQRRYDRICIKITLHGYLSLYVRRHRPLRPAYQDIRLYTYRPQFLYAVLGRFAL